MDIRITNLKKMYQSTEALKNINLHLPEGSFTAIVGPSGCGKTTLMRCLAGFLPVNEGTIHFGEQEVTHIPPQKREAAMVFQNYALWPHMTIFDNIAYGLKLRKLSKQDIENKVFEILEKVEIDTQDCKKRYPAQYSGGQQQRIALARALVLQPKLLLMDEPLSNLDAKVRQRLRIEIRRIQKELGITAVYVTHDQEEALSMADQVVLMSKGVIEQVGTPEELFRQPKSYFVAHFLGNSNTLPVLHRNDQLYLGSQPIPIEKKLSDGEYRLVVRNEDIQISFSPLEQEGFVTLKGVLKESLFVGMGYRHFIEVEGEGIFAHTEHRLTGQGKCYLHLPKDKCFVFPKEVEKGVRGYESKAV